MTEPRYRAAAATVDTSSAREESLALEWILRSQNISFETFFDSIWQVQCGVFSERTSNVSTSSISTLHPENNPFTALVRNGWNVLIRLLEATSDGDNDEQQEGDSNNDDVAFRPLLFQQQVQVPPDLAESKYGKNLFSAYLDGCSIVVNHSDGYVGEIAALCQDLQRSFPHAYANAYLTPPGLQAVPAHADDRDVFVIQVVGEKHWKVYQKIPVPYPYPDEQVGKDYMPVPPQVFETILVERTLRPGDVLYMPRGYVHEACASQDALSFHITVALATHDWSLAGLLSQMAASVWMNELDLRPAMHRDIGIIPLESINSSVKQQLQSDLDRAMILLSEQVTVEAVHQRMKHKFDRHNQRVASVRQAKILEVAQPSTGEMKGHCHVGCAVKVGPQAANHVTLETPLRCATPDEKASVAVQRSNGSPRGLHVRNEIFEPIMRILQTFKDNDTKAFTMRDFANGDSGRGVCELTLLSFARVCVEQGALVIDST